MDDFKSDEERTKSKALHILDGYELAVALALAEDVLKHESEFQDKEAPLSGLAPALLQKYYGVLYSLDTCKGALKKKCD
jgi:hypothetical protein